MQYQDGMQPQLNSAASLWKEVNGAPLVPLPLSAPSARPSLTSLQRSMAMDSEGEAGRGRRRVQVVRPQAAEPAPPALEQAQGLPAAGRRGGGAAADLAPAAAAATGAGRPAGPPWQRFRRERAACHARRDRLSASIFLAVIIAARFRVGDMPTSAQEAHGLALVFLTAAVMMWGQELAESGWGGLRNALVLALKLAAATCPLFHFYSQDLFSEYPKLAGPPAVLDALLRTAVADHTGLLLLLGTILPQREPAAAACLPRNQRLLENALPQGGRPLPLLWMQHPRMQASLLFGEDLKR
ncbi:hypothetical protein ABPG75_004287 [Micractinium tetrahymenae]